MSDVWMLVLETKFGAMIATLIYHECRYKIKPVESIGKLVINTDCQSPQLPVDTDRQLVHVIVMNPCTLIFKHCKPVMQ